MIDPVIGLRRVTLAHVELLFHILLYLSVFGYHSRTTIPAYNKKYRKSSNAPLFAHIAAGLFEVFRYDLRALHGPVYADSLDLIACAVQSFTNLYLVRTLLRGDKYITRPAYQAPAFLRIIFTVAACLLGSPSLHRASVRVVNAFVYTRTIIFVLGRINILRDSSYATIYEIGVFLGAVMGVAEGGLTGGVPVYVASVAAVAVLNRWTSMEVLRR